MEQALLCSLIIDKEAYDKISDLNITDESFYSNQHKIIFQAFIKLYGEVEAYDLTTIVSKLIQMGKLNEVGGVGYLAEVFNTVSTSANVVYHAEIIADAATKRSVIIKATHAVETAYLNTEPGDKILDELSSDLFLLSEKKLTTHPQRIDKLTLKTFADIEEVSKRDDGLSGITTGFKGLDAMLGGWQNKTLSIIAARPSMGKTVLGVNLAVNAAKQGHPVAFFSLEMGNDELTKRLFSSEGRIPLARIKSGKIEDTSFPNGWEKLANAVQKVSDLPLFIDDTTSLNMLDLRTKLRRLKKDEGVKIAFIDYVGLMDTDKGVERHEGISRISRGLKKLSKELDMPIILLSQLNREVDKRPDKRPMLSDLRESGAIEQDADNILFILRPEIYEKTQENDGQGIIIIGKQRSGPIGDVELHFNKSIVSFEEKREYY